MTASFLPPQVLGGMVTTAEGDTTTRETGSADDGRTANSVDKVSKRAQLRATRSACCANNLDEAAGSPCCHRRNRLGRQQRYSGSSRSNRRRDNLRATKTKDLHNLRNDEALHNQVRNLIIRITF